MDCGGIKKLVCLVGLSLELSEELRWDGSSQCAGSPY
jgi:hypothetical protein